ncbi:MAG TPA: trypsin-like serine protease [Actinomycetota bacterium]|nr:trypsin-like serine protease [Actinomycetota bacterium]
MKRVTVLLLLVVGMLAAAALPAAAITDGELDGNQHPNVAMIVFYQPDGRFRCSATLVSETVLVTAGHCTEGVRGKTIVTFDSVAPTPTPRAADDAGDGMSQTGYTSAPPGWLAGTPHAHPEWDGELQLNDLHDVGVVVLDEPYTAADPAQLPPEGYLDGVKDAKHGLNKQVFEVVGYGVFFEKPESGPQKPTAVADRTRRFTTAVGQNLTSQTLMLQENGNDSKAGGGTCFGDSGGPAFHGGYIVGDTSWGASQFCNSVGGFQRLDIEDTRSFLDEFVAVP